jgi:gamma-glutamyltranspeptidase
MVASVHELASRAGVEIMQAGGNAVDAAVATGFALAVVHPQAGNLGGGGFLLLRKATGEVRFIDFREKAPAAATANMYLDTAGNVIPDASVQGDRCSWFGSGAGVCGKKIWEAAARNHNRSGDPARTRRIPFGVRRRRRLAG